MEKFPGVALTEVWDGLSFLERYNIIERIVAMEKELANLEFPAYGALYLKDSIPAGLKQFPLPSTRESAELFCVGPNMDAGPCQFLTQFWFPLLNLVDTTLGPSLKDLGLSSVQRELNAIESSEGETKSHLETSNELRSLSEYRFLLERMSSILPTLSSDRRVLDVSRPVIWHTALRLENIFVSGNDPTHIQGIAGWRSSQISPLFLQARFPEFLSTPTFYNFGDDLPSLSGFSESSPEELQRALKIKDLVARSKYYEMCVVENNDLVYGAMKLDRRLLEPFRLCQLSSTGGLVPLRDFLVSISRDWATLGLSGDCPFAFTAEELAKHEEQVALLEGTKKLKEFVNDQLSTGDDGWVPAERWEATNQQNRVLFNRFAESFGDNSSHEAASKKWPFPPRET